MPYPETHLARLPRREIASGYYAADSENIKHMSGLIFIISRLSQIDQFNEITKAGLNCAFVALRVRCFIVAA